MIKFFQTKRRETTFYLRMWILFLCSVTITYGLLYIALNYGSIGLFFGGVIAGGLWGEFWHILFSESPSKWVPKDPIIYIILTFLIFLLLIVFLIQYPLPQI